MSEHTANETAADGVPSNASGRKRRTDMDAPRRLRVRLAPELPANVRRYRAGLGPFTHEPIEVLAWPDAEHVLRKDLALIVERVKA